MIQNTSTAGAMQYYNVADYLTEGQELIGRWHGHAASLLGLSGNVRRQEWDDLCQNRDPRSGRTLTQRLKEPRRVGYDFNFRAPKGLSLLYGLTGDQRLLDAFREAVDATMNDMEREMQTRVRKAGKDEDRTTGNMVWGEFVHFTSRPVDGLPDPHLHAHCFVFNTTWDSNEERWKAGQFAGLKRDAPYFEAKFHSRLAEKLGDLGIGVKRNKSSWEMDGLSSDLLRKFSRRTELIDKAAAAKGITDPEAKMNLSTRTREKKRKELSLPELRNAWAERMTADESASVRSITDRMGKGAVDRDGKAADRGAALAISHVFERKAVVPERMLLCEALKRSIGQASAEATERAVAGYDLLRADSNGRRFVTTRSVLSEEQHMIDFARKGRGTCRAFFTGQHVFADKRLNDQQRRAVTHVLTSRDRVIVIRGAAGVGKTTMMTEAVSAIEASGTKVFTFAPSADASRGVLRDEGFASADTVARLLKDERLQKSVEGNLLWIDEAGLLGTKTMKEVFDLAEKFDCRVVLSGDRSQHGSVERGAALRLLETEAGIVSAQIRQIQRQDGDYRAAVEKLSEGRIEDGFKKLDELGWIREVPGEERDRAIAAEYVAALKEGKTAMVVSPTHAEGDRITIGIRNALRLDKRLGKKEHDVLSLTSLSLTEADRADAASYAPGDVLVFHQNGKGYSKGERVTVGEAPLPLDQAKRFTAYHSAQLSLAKGDLVRITANGTTADGKHRLNNGSIHEIKRFSRSGDIILENGWKVARDYGHLALGYVVTSHASQGKTVDKVIIGQSAESFPASGKEQFYVSVSRGRKQAVIFTDHKVDLLKAVSKSDERLTATDLLAKDMTRQRVLQSQQRDRQFSLQSQRSRERDTLVIER